MAMLQAAFRSLSCRAPQAEHLQCLGTGVALSEALNFSREASRRVREGDVAAHELGLARQRGLATDASGEAQGAGEPA